MRVHISYENCTEQVLMLQFFHNKHMTGKCSTSAAARSVIAKAILYIVVEEDKEVCATNKQIEITRVAITLY
jgi:hypothetical protein